MIESMREVILREVIRTVLYSRRMKATLKPVLSHEVIEREAARIAEEMEALSGLTSDEQRIEALQNKISNLERILLNQQYYADGTVAGRAHG